MSTWFNPVDIYCERLDASFWAEPMNAISNLSFIVAGLLLWRKRSPRSTLMAILIILIGFCSLSFHTFANRLTGLLDVLAIAMYLARYLWLAVIVFPFSLLSRQLDIPFCDFIGGAHWLWHLLNGLTLYLSSYGLCLKQHSKYEQF